MSPCSWLLLLLSYLGYLALGMTVFQLTECPAELESRARKKGQELRLRTGMMLLQGEVREEGRQVLRELLDILNTDYLDDSHSRLECDQWDHVNCLFFAFTVVTTIGRQGGWFTKPVLWHVRKHVIRQAYA